MSVGRLFDAHLTATGIALDFVPPPSFVGEYPYQFVSAAMDENLKAVQAIYDKLRGAAELSGLMTELNMIEGLPGRARQDFGRMTRTFDAPRALVVRAMTEPELVQKWMGNSRSPMVGAEVDLRVGGRYRYTYQIPNGPQFSFVGVYRELSESRVVHTEAMEGMPGEAVVTTTFVESGGKTTMTVTMAFATQALRDQVLRTGMSDGAAESYDNLAALLSTLG